MSEPIFELIHSCLNCEKPIRTSLQEGYEKSLGYLLCSEKCLKEINDAYHDTYPNKPDAYDMTDVYHE